MKLLRATMLAVILGLASAGASQAQYVMDLGELIYSITIGDFGDDIEKLDRANNVYVERVSRLSGIRISGDTLDRAIDRRWRTLFHLQAHIRQVPAAMKALKRHHATVDQVIWMTATNDGSASLYIDDR